MSQYNGHLDKIFADNKVASVVRRIDWAGLFSVVSQDCAVGAVVRLSHKVVLNRTAPPTLLQKLAGSQSYGAVLSVTVST